MVSNLPPKSPAAPPSAVKLSDERTAHAAVGAATAAVAIAGVGLSLSMTLLAVRLAQAGYSGRAIGFNAAAGGLATFASAPFVPGLARRLGVRALLILSLFAGAICLCGFAALDGYWPWFALRILFGAALTVLFATSEFWISSAAAPKKRGLVMGLYTAAFAIGVAVGPILLPLAGEGNTPFLIAIGLFLLAGVPVGIAGSHAPVLEAPARRSILSLVAAMPAATCAALVYGAVETAGMGLLPVYALRSGFDPATGAFLVAIFALGNGVLQTPLGIISDRVDRHRLLLFVAGSSTIGALLLPLARAAGLGAFASLLFLWGGIVGSLYALGLAQLGSRYEGAELASGNAAYIALYSAGMLAGPPLMGLGLDLAPAGLFIALAALLFAYFSLALWRRS